MSLRVRIWPIKSCVLLVHVDSLRLSILSTYRGFVCRDAGGDNGPGNATSTAESHLGRNVDVWHVLVLAKQRQVQKDGERGGVGSEDDQLTDTTVEGPKTLIVSHCA